MLTAPGRAPDLRSCKNTPPSLTELKRLYFSVCLFFCVLLSVSSFLPLSLPFVYSSCSFFLSGGSSVVGPFYLLNCQTFSFVFSEIFLLPSLLLFSLFLAQPFFYSSRPLTLCSSFLHHCMLICCTAFYYELKIIYTCQRKRFMDHFKLLLN